MEMEIKYSEEYEKTRSEFESTLEEITSAIIKGGHRRHLGFADIQLLVDMCPTRRALMDSFVKYHSAQMPVYIIKDD